MKNDKHGLLRKGLKMLLILLSLIIVSIVCLLVFLLIQSPGKLEQYTDNEGKPLLGSVSEKTFVTIGGVRQGMFIKGKNIDNPVLLYVHGGPAFPNYFLIDKYKPGLEDYFTVCYWEQRGGGLSFTPEVTKQSMNFDQLTSDAIEVSNYLKNRFGKEKIYIMAHSGGTPIALLAVAQAPQLFHAYIAMAQITKQLESEKIAYQYILEKYKASGNEKAVNEIQKFKVFDADSNVHLFFKSAVRDQSMHELGIGTMHNMKSVFWDIFIPNWTCKAYTLTEKINIWKSKFSFLPKTKLVDELMAGDFTQRISKIDIPIYFISGKYDLTVNVNLSKDYFKKLDAPLKGFYIFESSAHSPIFEESARFTKILIEDVLKNTNAMADIK